MLLTPCTWHLLPLKEISSIMNVKCISLHSILAVPRLSNLLFISLVGPELRERQPRVRDNLWKTICIWSSTTHQSNIPLQSTQINVTTITHLASQVVYSFVFCFKIKLHFIWTWYTVLKVCLTDISGVWGARTSAVHWTSTTRVNIILHLRCIFKQPGE